MNYENKLVIISDSLALNNSILKEIIILRLRVFSRNSSVDMTNLVQSTTEQLMLDKHIRKSLTLLNNLLRFNSEMNTFLLFWKEIEISIH
jgi:hypothetical protein